jgi:hypothetical protein
MRLRKVLHVLAGNAAAEVWASMRPKTFEVKLARRIVQHFPQPTDIFFAKAATCLQILGILCCLSVGRDMIKCRCLQDFSRAQTIHDLKSHLRAMARDEAWPAL